VVFGTLIVILCSCLKISCVVFTASPLLSRNLAGWIGTLPVVLAGILVNCTRSEIEGNRKGAENISVLYMGLRLAVQVSYLEDPILIMSEKSVELYNLRYTEAAREHRMRTVTLWGEMDVTLEVILNLESRALRWYSHIERRREER